MFFHPEPGFLEPMEGNCSAHDRFCHRYGVTKNEYHLLHYNCEVFPSPLSLYSIGILDLGPNSKLPVGQDSVKSAVFSLLPLHLEELSREEPTQWHFSFPFLSPFSPYIMSLLTVSFMDSSCLRLESAKPSSQGLDGWTGVRLPDSLCCHN